MSSQFEPMIQQAITDARAGNKPAAMAALSKVVRQDPGNARAWYLLSQVVDRPEQAIYCLEQVLKVQPENIQAKQRLQKLRPVATPAPETFEDIPIATVPPLQPSHPTSSQKQTNWTLILVVLGVIAITCVCFGALAAILIMNLTYFVQYDFLGPSHNGSANCMLPKKVRNAKKCFGSVVLKPI